MPLLFLAFAYVKALPFAPAIDIREHPAFGRLMETVHKPVEKCENEIVIKSRICRRINLVYVILDVLLLRVILDVLLLRTVCIDNINPCYWRYCMHGYNLVAVYSSLEEAQRVKDRLLAEGMSSDDVRLTDAAMTGSTSGSTSDVPREPHNEGGFFNWLFASDVPDYDRNRYSTYLNENRVALSVRAVDQHWHDRIIAIMEEFNPIDIEEDGHAVTTERSTVGTSHLGATAVPTAGTTARTDLGTTARTDLGTTARTEHTATARTDMSREREEVIPVVKEELEVGKRATERRYRVKSYVIEHPVEKQVTLRDERVEIEHRPISRTGELSMPQEREIDVVERHEEPVVEKRVTGNEEIVVRKETVERPETVHGTVRETKVDVEEEPVGKAEQTTRTTSTDSTLGTAGRTPGRTDR